MKTPSSTKLYQNKLNPCGIKKPMHKRTSPWVKRPITKEAMAEIFNEDECQPETICKSTLLREPSTGVVELAVLFSEHSLVKKLCDLLTPERLNVIHNLQGSNGEILKPQCLAKAAFKQVNKFQWGFTPTEQGRYLKKGQSPTVYMNSAKPELQEFFTTQILPLLEEMQSIFKQVCHSRWAAQNELVPQQYSLTKNGGITAASLNWGNLVPLHIDSGDVTCGMSSLLIFHTGCDSNPTKREVKGGNLLLTDVGEKGTLVFTAQFFTLVFFLAHASHHAVLPIELPVGAKRISLVGYANKTVCARAREYLGMGK